MIPGEIKNYDGELAYTQFYIWIAAVGMWFNSFRIPRKHDNVPVIFSTPQRAYFLNQLAHYGFDTSNGKIPTPIISYYLSDYEHKKERDTPQVVTWYNKNDGTEYPNLIPYDCTFQVSVWTRKQLDMFELMYQIQESFDQGYHWIIFTDTETGMKQTTPFFLEGITDASNLEPGQDGQVEWRRDINLRAECYLPRAGYNKRSPISKLYLDLGTGSEIDNCTIEYASGGVDFIVKKWNTGNLCGVIEPNHIYFSGTVNSGQHDEEFVVENYTW